MVFLGLKMKRVVRNSKNIGLFSRQLSTAPNFRLVDYNSDEYQYLEKSLVPTMHFQNSLPRLPIPKLDKTIDRYLSAVKPLVKKDQFKATEKLAESFRNFDGAVLHKELTSMNNLNKHTSYISEPWFDMYLKARVPLPVNFNPFMVWNFDPEKKYNDQISRAANIVISACRFKRSLDANILQPEVFHLNPAKSDTLTFRRVTKAFPTTISWYAAYFFKAFPLDMSQHPSLFNTTRIPALGKDQLHRNHLAKHLIVLKKGHVFAVDVLNDDGNITYQFCYGSAGTIKRPDEIHAFLLHINNMDLLENKFSVGVLTTLERDLWAQYRSQLIQAGNEIQLKTIDDGLFVLCLDDVRTDDPINVSKNLLNGNPINRWYDKSLSVIMHADGLAAVNFEHSWGDGVAVLRFMEDVYRDTCKNRWVKPTDLAPGNVDCSKFVRKLEFKFPDMLKNILERLTSTTENSSKDKMRPNLDFSVLQYRKMDRDFLKKQKVSPDAVMQLAIQIAFYRIYKTNVATYESCSTAAFKHGRTETVRPATYATKTFVRAILETKDRPSVARFRELIEDCSKVHVELVKNAAMGQGFDRHLFALRYLVERRGEKLPDFFMDKTYQYANQYVLSTSTLSTPTIMLGGFGPVVPDGLGIGYNVVPGEIGCIVTAYNPLRNAGQFTQALEQSLDEIREIFEKIRS